MHPCKKNLIRLILIFSTSISHTGFSSDFQTTKKLAEQGNATAQFDLGTFYDEGAGVEKNFNEAAKWYRKAAEQGEVAAQYNLAIMYDTGEGVKKDIIEAYAWEIFGYNGAQESSKDFRQKMTAEQITIGDQKIMAIVNRITANKNKTAGN